MKTCHLHIGMHKTGSSSIQNYLSENRDKLEKHGYYYADMGSPNHSGPFLFSSRFNPSEDDEIINFNLPSHTIDKNIEIYREKLHNSLARDCENVVFSAESIVKLSLNELTALKEIISNYVDDIKVYCYVRKPMSFSTSAFQQIVKTVPIDFDNENILPLYEKKLNKIGQAFGHINYRLFSIDTLISGNVTADFCEWLGIPYWGSTDANQSLSALAIKFLYNFQPLRKKITVSQEMLELVENTLSKLPYKKLILPSKVMEHQIEMNMADFEWMKNQLLPNKYLSPFIDINHNHKNYGNIYGVFSQNEKELLLNVINKAPEFKSFVENETELSLESILESPLKKLDHLVFYITKIDNKKIQGWSSHINTEDFVTLEIYINDDFQDSIKSDIERVDLKDKDNKPRRVGYTYSFNKKINQNDIITVYSSGQVLYSGHLD